MLILLQRPSQTTSQDFFRKLKFKYLEQEAKSEFTHSIVGETPRVLAPRENDKLGKSSSAPGMKRGRSRTDTVT